MMVTSHGKLEINLRHSFNTWCVEDFDFFPNNRNLIVVNRRYFRKKEDAERYAKRRCKKLNAIMYVPFWKKESEKI